MTSIFISALMNITSKITTSNQPSPIMNQVNILCFLVLFLIFPPQIQAQKPFFLKTEVRKDSVKVGDTLFVNAFLYKKVYTTINSVSIQLDKNYYKFGFLKKNGRYPKKMVKIGTAYYSKEHIASIYIIPQSQGIDTLEFIKIKLKAFEQYVYPSKQNTSTVNLASITLKNSPQIVKSYTDLQPINISSQIDDEQQKDVFIKSNPLNNYSLDNVFLCFIALFSIIIIILSIYIYNIYENSHFSKGYDVTTLFTDVSYISNDIFMNPLKIEPNELNHLTISFNDLGSRIYPYVRTGNPFFPFNVTRFSKSEFYFVKDNKVEIPIFEGHLGIINSLFRNLMKNHDNKYQNNKLNTLNIFNESADYNAESESYLEWLILMPFNSLFCFINANSETSENTHLAQLDSYQDTIHNDSDVVTEEDPKKVNSFNDTYFSYFGKKGNCRNSINYIDKNILVYKYIFFRNNIFWVLSEKAMQEHSSNPRFLEDRFLDYCMNLDINKINEYTYYVRHDGKIEYSTKMFAAGLISLLKDRTNALKVLALEKLSFIL